MAKLARMNRLSKKVSKKTGLSIYETDAILKVAAYELVETLKKEQRFYWEGLGTFRVTINDYGLSLYVRLNDECYNRLNEKEEGDKKDEIVFE
jgi:hypothetical protein